jgi:hypothetical protein
LQFDGCFHHSGGSTSIALLDTHLVHEVASPSPVFK